MQGYDSEEERFYALTQEIMSDTTPLKVTINVQAAWMLISAIQLACRHPHFPLTLRRAVVAAARQFQEVISNTHPGAYELIETGWNPEHDVQADTSGPPRLILEAPKFKVGDITEVYGQQRAVFNGVYQVALICLNEEQTGFEYVLQERGVSPAKYLSGRFKGTELL